MLTDATNPSAIVKGGKMDLDVSTPGGNQETEHIQTGDGSSRVPARTSPNTA